MATYKPGEVVWTKMRGFPMWPGLIPKSSPEIPGKKPDTYCVYFFGSHNFAWIKQKDLLPNSDALLQEGLSSKKSKVRAACRELEQHVYDTTEMLEDINLPYPRASVMTRERSPPTLPPAGLAGIPLFSRPPRRIQPIPRPPVMRPTPGPSGLQPTPGPSGLQPTPGPSGLQPTPGPSGLQPTPGPSGLQPSGTQASTSPSQNKTGSKRKASNGTTRNLRGTSSGFITRRKNSNSKARSVTKKPRIRRRLGPQVPAKKAVPSTSKSSSRQRNKSGGSNSKGSSSQPFSIGQKEECEPSTSRPFIPRKDKNQKTQPPPRPVLVAQRAMTREEFYHKRLGFKNGKSMVLKSQSSFVSDFGLVGALGMNIQGFEICKKLLAVGFHLMVWGPDQPDLINELVQRGAILGVTPCDIVSQCNINFSFFGSPTGALDVFWGNIGILSSMGADKGLIEMSNVDYETSRNLSMAIKQTGANYLEAQIQGGLVEVQNGKVTLLCAGDLALYVNITSFFDFFCAGSYYLGVSGLGCAVNSIIQLIKAIMVAGMAEGMALALSSGFSLTHVMQVFRECSLKSNLLLDVGSMIASGAISGELHEIPMGPIRFDLWNALRLGDRHNISLPLAASSREAYSSCRKKPMRDNYHKIFF